MSPIKRIALLFILIFSLSLPANAAEVILESAGNAEDIIGITSFADSDEILNPAYAENFVALGLMYHSTGGKFLPGEGLSNALALRLVFRSVGKEEEANMLAHNQVERLAAGLGDYDNLSWADGYYLLALKEGLLNKADITDAYSNPDSPLARDENVSAQNLIKWLTIAQNVFLTNHSLPSDVYIDGAYSIYYASLYKYGLFTADDVRYFAPYRHITRDDIALLLGKFENYILSNMKIRSGIGTVTGINIKFSGDDYIRTINCYASGQYFKLRFTGKNIASPQADISGEIPVFGKGQPDISGVLRKGDKVKFYYKDDRLLFIRVTDFKEKEEVRSSPVHFSGSLFLYDPTSETLVLNCDGELKRFYVSKNLHVYRRLDEINKSELSDTVTDKDIIIYADSHFKGGLYRVYSVLTN